MYRGNKIIAIIPARGGSKGIPRKNIKKFVDRPLLSWTIGQANASNYIDKIVVSTDDDEIIKLCEYVEIEYLKRPDKYAKDTSPSSEAIIHVLDYYKYYNGLQYDIVLMIECTSPLRKSDDIDNAIEWFIDNIVDYDSCIGITKIKSDTHHPLCVKKEPDGYIIPYIDNSRPIYQRQQLDECYSVCGGVYMSKVYIYMDKKTFYTERTLGYKMDSWQQYEIDSEDDFIICETLYQKYCL